MSIRTTAQNVSVLSGGDGKLRTTSQNVNVLSGGDGKLRVTGQSINVLSGGDGDVRLSEQLIEVLSSYDSSNIIRTPSSSLALSHEVVYTPAYRRASNDLTLSHSTWVSPHFESVETNLSLSQEALISQQEVIGVVSQPYLTHEVDYTVKLDVNHVEHTIDWLQFADNQQKGRSVSNTLDLDHYASGTRGTVLEQNVITELVMSHWIYRGGTFRYEPQTNLTHSELITVQTYDGNGDPLGYVTIVVEDGLRQSVDIAGTYNDFNDGNHIGIKDTVSYLKIPFIGTDASATSTISLSQDVSDSLGIDSNIILVSSATADRSTGADHSELDLSQSVVYSAPGQRAPEHTIGVTQSVSIIVPRTDCTFDISVGSTTQTGLPTPPVPPTLTLTDRISLAFPAAAPTTTLFFNAPEFGNIEEIYHRRIDRHTRGGKRIVFRDDNWRDSHVFKITLTAITEAETVNLLAFIKNSAGDVVKFTDHESRSWDTIIINPEEPIIRDRVGNTLAMQLETI